MQIALAVLGFASALLQITVSVIELWRWYKGR